MRAKYYWANLASYILLVISVAGSAYVIGYVNGILAERRSGDYPILREVHHLLKQYYLGDMAADTQLDYGAVRGLLAAAGDPYSVFLEPPSQELETQSLQGEYGGIGVGLRQNEDGDILMSPFPDYPAIEAGIQEGDMLVAIDGVRLTPEMTLDQVSALIRGLVGTQVKIAFRHGADEPREVTLTRESIEIPSVSGRLLEADPTIGLVSLTRFSEKTPAETQRTIDNLQSQGATRIVLDLRGNGGGLLDSAIKTTSIFLDGGVIMYEIRRGEGEKTYTAPAGGPESDVSLAVLVNHSTASAAEILAGALRDRGRAPLIGQSTYGKGSVQLIFELSDHSSVHITNARWYTPQRAQIDHVGLKPDIEMEPGTNGADPELARAIQYLQSLK